MIKWVVVTTVDDIFRMPCSEVNGMLTHIFCVIINDVMKLCVVDVCGVMYLITVSKNVRDCYHLKGHQVINWTNFIDAH